MRTKMRRGRGATWTAAAALAVELAVAGAGCGEFLDIGRDEPFSNMFRDNRDEDVRKVVARLPAPSPEARPTNALGRPLIVGLRYGSPGVFAHDLDAGALLWSRDMPVGSRPVIAGGVVVVQSGLNVMALDLADGSDRWRVDTEGFGFFGAGWDDKNVYVALGVEASRVGRLIAVRADTGRVAWRVQTGKLFGRPAAAGGLVFVPWDRQNVSVLDRETQEEVARLRSTDDVINFVFAGPRGVFYGSRGVYLFDDRSYAGTKAGSTYWAPSMQGVPGDPELWADGFAAPTGGRNAREKIRYFFMPGSDASAGRLGLEHDAVFLLYFRFVVAFDAHTGAIRWTFRHRTDIESMSVEPSGAFLVDSSGTVLRLHPASGLPDWQASIGVDVAAAVFDIAGFSPPSAPSGSVLPLRTQLLEAILDQDNRLLPIRQYALGVLAAMPEPEVTRDILDVYAQRTSPQALKDTARAALAARQGGAEFLVGALDTHTDYLMNTTAPPMGVVSQALASMGARGAVTGLVAHLLDPETPMDDLQEVAQALIALGDAGLITTFQSYLTLYHSDSAFAANTNALNVISDGLLKYGGAPERAFLDALLADPYTLPGLKIHIRGRYEEVEEARRAAEEAARLAAAAAAAAAAPPVVAETIPQTLSREAIDRTITSHSAEIAPCVHAQMERTPSATQIRMIFKLVSAGDASDLQVLPDDAELKACLADKLAVIRFPRFLATSQRAQFTIDIRPPAPPPGPPTPPIPPPPPTIVPPVVVAPPPSQDPVVVMPLPPPPGPPAVQPPVQPPAPPPGLPPIQPAPPPGLPPVQPPAPPPGLPPVQPPAPPPGLPPVQPPEPPPVIRPVQPPEPPPPPPGYDDYPDVLPPG